MPLTIVRNDITKMQVDAIVNAANTDLQPGGGVCGAIFSAAGAAMLQAACDKLAPIRTGEAVITGGFSLPVKYVIHTAGPVYRGGKSGEEAELRASYISALDLAKKNNCESIAFPLISSGIYGYPKDEALSVATGAIGGWLANNDMDVTLVMFDKTAFKLSLELHSDVQSFIDEHYADTHEKDRGGPFVAGYDGYSRTMQVQRHITPVIAPPAGRMRREASPEKLAVDEAAYTPLMISQTEAGFTPGRLDEPFSATLLRLIDSKGKSDVEVYKRANIDRKLFSKIRSGKGYMPGKKTVVALAIALELTLPETRSLLECAGFALSRSVMFDVIIEYFITRSKYDIFEINNVLFQYDQPLLGC